jgi:hypothetical protein
VCAVGELQGEFVFPGLQEHQAFGLPFIEMFVLVIIWDNVTGLDISGVDQYMKMTTAFAFVLYGGYAHTFNFEFQGKRRRDGGAIARLDKINRLRIGMRSE